MKESEDHTEDEKNILTIWKPRMDKMKAELDDLTEKLMDQTTSTTAFDATETNALLQRAHVLYSRCQNMIQASKEDSC